LTEAEILGVGAFRDSVSLSGEAALHYTESSE
jgi:hypothetical protein